MLCYNTQIFPTFPGAFLVYNSSWFHIQFVDFLSSAQSADISAILNSGYSLMKTNAQI